MELSEQSLAVKNVVQFGLYATGLMKVVSCYALQTVVQGFGTNETLHVKTTTFWAQLLLGVGVQLSGQALNYHEVHQLY
jgi:hypothetical protein